MPMWTAIIAAGAAIFSSALTSYLTHCFERRRRKREYELKWLEERFEPALTFLGNVLAIISNAPNKQEERERLADQIRNVVAGPSQEDNAWCIAILLDPEDTGLREHVSSAMRYARITESAEEFNNYWARLSLSLEALANEYRKERQAIASGTSLESLIRGRKTEAQKATRGFQELQRALRAFLDGELGLDPTLSKIESSGIRGATLNLMLRPSSEDNRDVVARLGELRRECTNRGWFSDDSRA